MPLEAENAAMNIQLQKLITDNIVNNYLMLINLAVGHETSKDSLISVIKEKSDDIGYYTGMRKGEILALNKDDVDLAGRTITINKQVIRGEHKDDTMLQLSPKTDASMSKIPIVPQLCDILTDWFKRDPYEIVITDKEGNYINPDNVTGFCSNMSRILGFHFNFHMLRHAFTTNLIDNGVAPKVVQTLDRHANISTTLNYYDHVSMEKQNEALNDLFGQPEKKLSYKIATNPKS